MYNIKRRIVFNISVDFEGDSRSCKNKSNIVLVVTVDFKKNDTQPKTHTFLLKDNLPLLVMDNVILINKGNTGRIESVEGCLFL